MLLWKHINYIVTIILDTYTLCRYKFLLNVDILLRTLFEFILNLYKIISVWNLCWAITVSDDDFTLLKILLCYEIITCFYNWPVKHFAKTTNIYKEQLLFVNSKKFFVNTIYLLVLRFTGLLFVRNVCLWRIIRYNITLVDVLCFWNIKMFHQVPVETIKVIQNI